ncbi:response regulator [Mucilaginibacter terrenus]|uniref:histidine kinase n=1 Tax=Mucilaginibacter terrenus TaxID=2482727 RepID=A0A3E2NNY5_9SPHI|nr:ATP-binding protein [Mucilaginibacter terrenus]RFZ82698.1 response regulator [Mucilaginibacter terrenus]
MSPYTRRLTFSKAVLTCVMLFAAFYGQAQQQPAAADPLSRLKDLTEVKDIKLFGDSLLKKARQQNNKVLEGRILSAVSYKCYKAGEEIEALKYAQQGAVVAPKSDSVTYVRLRTLIAWMYSRQGNSKEALKIAFAVLRESEQAGWKALVVDCKICISDLFRPVKNAANAIAYADQAAKESLAIKDTIRYVNAISMLANAYSNNPKPNSDLPPENLRKAVYYLETLLKKPFEDKLNLFAKVNIMGNLGMFYQDQNRFNEAEKITLAAYELAKKNNFVSLQKHDLRELMTIEIGRKDFKKAVEYGERALATQAEANSSRLMLVSTYRRLTEAYTGVGNYKLALKYSEKTRDLNDSLLSEDQQRIASDLDKRYKADTQLLVAAHNNTMLTQQRNFIILLGSVVLVILTIVYTWIAGRKKREAAALAEEHRQLAQLDTMKNRFLANISHELKTPLTLIMGPAEQLLNHNVVPEQQKSNLLAIQRNGKKLLDIVNELLDLGKIESGNITLKPSTVNIHELITLIFQSFTSAAEYKKVSYSLSCDIDRALTISIDRDKFEKIANNLISNALKFTPASHAVNVKATTTNGFVNFTVHDNGDGIHPDDVPYIFDRYFQSNRNTPAEGGTGIGLSIAKEFAELMGGTVKVESSYGLGSTFTAEIPIVAATKQDKAPKDAKQLSIIAKTTFLPVTESSTILLVEDHREMADYIISIIGQDYQVLTADSGISALSSLDSINRLPDLIISDVMMPGMDGFTLLDHLKAHPKYFKIPVIMLTALADSKSKMRALHTGVDDYLTKPFMRDELLARAANLINNAAFRDKPAPDEQKEDSLLVLPVACAQTDPEPLRDLSPSDMAWLATLEDTVRKFIGKTDLNLAMLSYEMAISERQLFRRIKAITGLTPNKYIRTIRLQIAREAIESGRYRTVAEIAYAAGFDTPAYFSKLYKEHFGRDASELI